MFELALAVIGMAGVLELNIDDEFNMHPEKNSAHLFAYDLFDQEKFDNGYKSHLDWHKGAQDKLCWYGWTVSSGKNVGRFIDGAFGASHEEFDARPDPAGDGADFAQKAAPFAHPAWFSTLQLLPTLSTSYILEKRQPTFYVDAYYVAVGLEDMMSFELELSELTKEAKGSLRSITWYKVSVGGALTNYLALAHRNTWKEMNHFEGLDSLFGDQTNSDVKRRRENILRYISNIDSEVWRYRADLSLCPR